MTIDELNREYNKKCNEYERCNDCPYKDNYPCQLSFGYEKGRTDAINEFIDILISSLKKSVQTNE